MGTILETMQKLGAEPPKMLNFTSEDLPYLIMAANMAGDAKTTNGLMMMLAIRIEQLEEELFELKMGNKE